MSKDDLFKALKARGNFGHAGRPGKRGGSAPRGSGVPFVPAPEQGGLFDKRSPTGETLPQEEGFWSPKGGRVYVGDKVYVQSPLMRKRGIQPKGGKVETLPDANNMFDVAGQKFHVDDVIEVHHKK